MKQWKKISKRKAWKIFVFVITDFHYGYLFEKLERNARQCEQFLSSRLPLCHLWVSLHYCRKLWKKCDERWLSIWLRTAHFLDFQFVWKVPLIYSFRCIDFKKPHFTIGNFLSHHVGPFIDLTFICITRIHATNESEAYLSILIHVIGLHLKSAAHCTQIRYIRHGQFTLEDSLVRRHWHLECLFNNMTACQNFIQKYPEMLRQLSPTLHEKKV